MIQAAQNLFPCQIYTSELIEEGFTVIEDVEPTNFEDGHIQLHVLFKKIDGSKDLKSRLGLCDVKYFLDHQQMIPDEFRGNHLVFMGTVLMGLEFGVDYVSYLTDHVPYLCWNPISHEWTLNFKLMELVGDEEDYGDYDLSV